jgi:transposase-like protein
MLILEHTQGDHPLVTAQTLDYFAAFRAAQHRYEEAASFAEPALAIREQVLGAEDPQTKEARERLRVALAALERAEETKKDTEAQPEPAAAKDVEKFEEMGGELRSVLPACPRCQGKSGVVKSGTNKSGSPRFRCQGCHRYFTPQFAPQQYGRAQKEQAVLLAQQGKSYRFIARQMGVNHRTISAWIKAGKRDGDSPGAMA